MKSLVGGILTVVSVFSMTFSPTIVLAAGREQDRHPCAPSFELSMEEHDALTHFRILLGHLSPFYGKPEFETKLKTMVRNEWPKAEVIQVSPFFAEKAMNLVDQARLRNAVARMISLESKSWERFERVMMNITVFDSIAGDLMNPMDQVVLSLLDEVGRVRNFTKIPDKKWKQLRTEALTRIADMNTYLLRWKVLNGQMIDDIAAAEAKKVAMVAIGLVGAGVLMSTFVVAGPLVSGAGSAAGALSSNPVTAALLVKVAETAAGSTIGFFGAPAALTIEDTYHVLSEASKQSANRQTNFNCELSKEIGKWQSKAPGRLLSASMVGAGMGAAGGLLTFTSISAKAVLVGTAFGVSVAQLYSLGRMTEKTIDALAYYKMAEEAEDQGDHIMAVTYLKQARNLAQEAGDYAVESILVATLTYHVSNHFLHALHEGESAIRQLYAASADTLPTAGSAAIKMGSAIRPILTGATTQESACQGKAGNCKPSPQAEIARRH